MKGCPSPDYLRDGVCKKYCNFYEICRPDLNMVTLRASIAELKKQLAELERALDVYDIRRKN